MIPWDLLIGELLLGIGAALLLGTGTALFRYWRTGTFPGQPEGAEASLTSAWVKVALGVVLVLWGLGSLDRAGFI